MFTKTLIAFSAAIVLSAAAAAPAMSATSKTRVTAPETAFAQFTRMNVGRHSTNPANDVYVRGMYAGSDPDAFIRGSLARDPSWNHD
jgi:hypothetical protein